MPRPSCAPILLLAILFSSCTGPSPTKGAGEGGAWEALGTVCSVNAFEDGSPQLSGRIKSRLEEIDAAFSVNREDSAVSRINRAAGKERVCVEADVFSVIRSARRFAKQSGGAFDPTVGPLVLLWGVGSGRQTVPSQEEIGAALALVDWRKLSLDEADSSVFLEQEGMSLDLGGIAKGFAADEIVRILEEQQVERAVIDLGGNIYVFGSKAGGGEWRVGVKNPADGGGTVAAVLSLPGNLSVVTSGSYERFFVSGGRIYHHIIDPKTGFPGENGVASATIVAPSSMEADAMSTAAFLMGEEAFSRAFPSARCLFIAADGRVSASAGLSVSAR